MSAILEIKSKDFKKLIKDSKNWTEVMIYFKENHNYKSIRHNGTPKKRCERENIDFSHFTIYNNKKVNNKLKPLKEILVKYSTYNQQRLKKRLLKNKLLKNECIECKLGHIWNNKQIVLQLEHINGDHYDNRIENLAMICPNCHSQTDTFCGKNRNDKTENKCTDCNEKINKQSSRCIDCYKKQCKPKQNTCRDCKKNVSKNATRCRSCASIESNKNNRKVKNRPSLEQLQKDLITLSVVKTGIKYGVSDNCIRGWIKRYKK